MDNPYQAPSADLHSANNTQAIQYVGFWTRTGAYFIDMILLMLIIYPLLFLVLGTGAMDGSDPTIIYSPLYWIISFVLPIALFMFFWFTKSSTPGKMLFKAKIVDAKTGGKPSKGQFVGRYFGYILSSIPLCLGFFWIGWDKRKQGWHDKMSGTIVVKPTTDPAKQISFD
jgi:uncharacterized RDD family membrane protein YckC